MDRAAVNNVELRSFPLRGVVDWEQTARSDEMIGPQLREVVKVPAQMPPEAKTDSK